MHTFLGKHQPILLSMLLLKHVHHICALAVKRLNGGKKGKGGKLESDQSVDIGPRNCPNSGGKGVGPNCQCIC